MSAVKCWCGGVAADNWPMNGDPVRRVCLASPYHDPDATGHKTILEVSRLYIAGPMTGYPDCNYPAFNAAAERLRAAGFEVVNPAEISAGARAHYVDYLREDLRAMLDCEGVAVLPGWEFSTGARNEVNVAGLLKMHVRSVETWEEVGSL